MLGYTKLCEWKHHVMEMYERGMRLAIALWVGAPCPGGDVREGNALGYSSVSGSTVPRSRYTREECAGLY